MMTTRAATEPPVILETSLKTENYALKWVVALMSAEEGTKWILECKECGSKKELEVGFNLYDMGEVYVFCPICRKNTFHKVLGHEDPGRPSV